MEDKQLQEINTRLEEYKGAKRKLVAYLRELVGNPVPSIKEHLDLLDYLSSHSVVVSVIEPYVPKEKKKLDELAKSFTKIVEENNTHVEKD